MDDGLNASTDGTDIYIDAASMLVRVSDDAEEGKLSEYGSTNDGYAATEGNGALTLSVNGESNRSLEWSKAEYGENAGWHDRELLEINLPDADAKPETMRSLAEKYSPDEIRVYEPSLNDIFIEYTREAEEVK